MKKHLILFLTTAILLIGCGEKSEKEKTDLDRTSDQDTVEKIENLESVLLSAPSGYVSLDEKIAFKFEQDIVPDHSVNSILDENTFEFSPEIEGKAYWSETDKLVFEPTDNLPAGKDLKGTLAGEKALGKRGAGTSFTFDFKTPQQEVKELDYEFKPVDSNKKGMVRLSAELDFYAPVDMDKIQKELNLDLEGHDLSFSSRQKNEYSVEINTEKFQRGRKIKHLNFSLPEDYTPYDEEWNKQLIVSEINKFRILTSMPLKEEDKTYAFRFSNSIDDRSDLSGFVSVEPSIPFEVKIEGKYLKVKGDFLAGKEYKITIQEGLPSRDGQTLDNRFVKSIRFSNIKPKVEWVSEGVYLPSANNHKVQFKSVNLKKAELRIFRIFSDNLGFFLQSNVLKTDDDYDDINRTGEKIYDKEININGKRNEWTLNEIDLSSVFEKDKRGAYVMFLEIDDDHLIGEPTNDEYNIDSTQLYYTDDGYHDNPAESGYYHDHAQGEQSKLLISSDIGLTLKETEQGKHVYAIDMVKSKPVKNLELKLYSYENQVVETQKTDKNGHVLFEKDGYYIKGETKSGVALLKTDHDNLEISNFDVSGVSTGREDLNIFTYTDRGVYRPGKTIHFSAIVRSGRDTPPKDQPLILKVYNPEDQLVIEKTKNIGEYGHCYFNIETSNDAPTGDWKAQLEFAGETFEKWIKVETVKPNRIKVNTDFPDKLTGSPLLLQGSITSQYLFGAPAADSKVEVEATLQEREISIPGYEEYSFDDPNTKFTSRRRDILEDNLNDKGKIEVNKKFSREVEQAKSLQALVKSTVYEKGGNPVSKLDNITIYPDTVFPGIRRPEDRYLKKGETYNFPIITAGISGKLIPNHNLKITHYVNRYHWWWHFDEDDKKKFRKLKNTFKIDDKKLVSNDKPLNYKVTLDDRGTHYIIVQDKTTGQSTGIFFRSSHWGDDDRRKKQEQNFLQITTDRDVYIPDEEAQISFKSPEQGLYLCTVEQDDNILKQFVNNVDKGETTISLDITEKMIPNCYISISLIQPHGQTKNDIPLRTYGIKPIKVESPETHLKLRADIPDKVRPQEKFNITVRNKSDKDGSATIAIVDEGLLDLTNFSTPQPWQHYFQKIGLSVSTSDNYDEILGALLPDVDKKYSIGGSARAPREERSGYEDTQDINRFKPTVLFKKPTEIESNSSRTFSFEMPNYVGSVRAMIVGCGNNSYGSIEEYIKVKKPLMVLPTIPRQVHPGDQFVLPVSVFAMQDEMGEVEVNIETSDNLSLISSPTQTTSFNQEGEKMVKFKVKALDAIGESNIKISAQSEEEKATQEVDLPLSPANPFITKVTEKTIHDKGQVSLTPKKFGLESTNSAELVFAKIPDLNLDKQLNHLIRYPYGCIEQTTSKSFAQLYIDDLIALRKGEKQAAQRFVKAGIDKLSSFKTSRGFSYWPHNSEGRDWCTTYAGHFMISAKKLGYNVPQHLIDHWIRTAKSRARDVNSNDHRYQTYRLLVLALSDNSAFGAMNLLRQNYLDDMGVVARKLLAASYHISGKEDIADDINDYSQTKVSSYREMSGTFGSDIRDMALMAYCSNLMDDTEHASQIIKSITDRVNSGRWYSTQEMSFITLALAKFYTKSGLSQSDIEFTVDMEGKGSQEYTLSNMQKSIDISDMYNKKIEIDSKTESPLFVYLNREGIPKKDEIKTGQQGIIMSRKFYDEDGQIINIDTLQQNQSAWVRYRVKSSTGQELEEVVLSSLFPSGWEIINPRMTKKGYPDWVQRDDPTNGNYMDIRDDRVNWFFDVDEDPKSFYIKINPTFAGKFKFPPASAETMYSPEYYARLQSREVVVK